LPIEKLFALTAAASRTALGAPARSSAMYRVCQEIHFCYGHRLLDYSGKCRYLHGHNGKAVVVLEAESLDKRGMLVDFADIKRSLCSWIDSELDHRMILCETDPAIPHLRSLGEPLVVIPKNPTAENIARLIFEHARLEGLPVTEVSLWESLRSCATYRPTAS
jgi:6-pyruvoyltetrahydropterin/6-carboxytetrahydropterin synthase